MKIHEDWLAVVAGMLLCGLVVLNIIPNVPW